SRRAKTADEASPSALQGSTPTSALSGGALLGRSGFDETLDEREGGLGDFAPAVIDRERVPTTRNLDDLRHTFVPPLPFVGGVRYGPRDGVVLLAVHDQQRSPIRVLRVDLRFGPRVEVCRRGLEQRRARSWDREGVVELVCLGFAHRV